MSAPTVAIVGGGITGLVAAREVAQGLQGSGRVLLLEASDRLGGKVFTGSLAGVPVEAGADWFVTRRPEALELCRELGLEEELVPPARSGALLWTGGRALPLPTRQVRGVPLEPIEAARAGLISEEGARDAAAGLDRHERLTGPDVSVAELVRGRLGREILERLVDPMLSASRAGSPDELSLAAAAPELDHAAREHDTLGAGLATVAPQAGSDVPPFLGLRGGMEALVHALHARTKGVEWRTGARVERVRQEEEGAFELETSGGVERAEAVVVCAPAPVTARLLEELSPDAAREIGPIRYSPAAVIALEYAPEAGSAPDHGSGILVPSVEDTALVACAWYSAKWAHAATTDGSTIVRAFAGRSNDDRALALEDDELVQRIATEVSMVTGLTGEPRTHSLVRWPDALPVYEIGHLERVTRIESAVGSIANLRVAGAGYSGSGLPDCIAQGRAAARKIVESLSR